MRDVGLYARTHPWALWRPRVVHGYFPHAELGGYQKIFFDTLAKNGFRRTRWQLVLPGQTAGLIKKTPPRPDGTNQYHVRFYANGTIDCEVEHGNFHAKHWSGTRYASVEVLNELLDQHAHELKDIPVSEIRRLFVLKPQWFARIVKKGEKLV